MKDKDEYKIINFTFRLSPKYKKWLDLIVEKFDTTASAFFNLCISEKLKEYVGQEAVKEGLYFAAKEFGLSEKIGNALKNPAEIEVLIKDEEKGNKFLFTWFNKAIENINKYNVEYGINFEDDELDSLLNEMFGEYKYKVLQFYFNSQLKLFEKDKEYGQAMKLYFETAMKKISNNYRNKEEGENALK